jgi:hypothetical protein
VTTIPIPIERCLIPNGSKWRCSACLETGHLGYSKYGFPHHREEARTDFYLLHAEGCPLGKLLDARGHFVDHPAETLLETLKQLRERIGIVEKAEARRTLEMKRRLDRLEGNVKRIADVLICTGRLELDQ